MNPALTASLIAVLLVTGLVLLILFLYVNSVMRFVLFDSVVTRECRIWPNWTQRQGQGRRYLSGRFCWPWFQSCVSPSCSGCLRALLFWWAGSKTPRRENDSEHSGRHGTFLCLSAFLVVQLVVHVMTKDFVVPQMALEEISAIEGWRRLWPR